MNTHERHELQKNELAKVTEEAKHWLQTDFYDKYGNHLLTGVSVAAILLAGWIYWSRTTTNREIAAWQRLTSASTASEYRAISDSYLGTRAAPWAKLKEAELALSDGVKESFTDREASKSSLDEAHTAVTELLGENPPPEVRERALYTLARCEDAQCAGDVSKPITAYETLLAEFPDTMYKPLAQERVEALKRPDAKEFYAWFAKQKPKPPVAPGPKDATGKPSDDGVIPSLLPDLPLPPPSKPKAPATPEGEKPAPAETPAKPEAPAAEPKPEAKPAEPAPAKPAEDKPAEKPAAPAAEKPAEPKPEAKPAEPAPAKPAEEKPAEPAKP